MPRNGKNPARRRGTASAKSKKNENLNARGAVALTVFIFFAFALACTHRPRGFSRCVAFFFLGFSKKKFNRVLDNAVLWRYSQRKKKFSGFSAGRGALNANAN